MDHVYPTFYKEFRCIAAACPDSCCQGWDVVIDSDTEAFYRSVPGAFGDKLRETIFTDADGDRIFRLAENKKCPFWGEDRLCDIYRELGEERLCATCAAFPRLRMEYAGFTEHTLALSCPEAARLILSSENAYADFTRTEAAGCEDYEARTICFLLQARSRAAALLTADQPLAQRLDNLASYAAETQKLLCSSPVFDTPKGEAFFAQAEYIDEQNREKMIRAVKTAPSLSAHEKALTNLALYWLYRYFLSAVNTGNITAPVQFLILSVRTVAALAENEGLAIALAAQLYSKEIEQSYVNMEALGM